MAAMPPSLHLCRGVLDKLDDALVDLLALRQQVVRAISAGKNETGLPVRDPVRETAVLNRARARARRRGLNARDGERLLRAAIDCALDLQQQPGADQDDGSDSAADTAASNTRESVMRLPSLPPPERLAILLRAVPYAWHARVLEVTVNRVLAAALQSGKLDFMRDRRLAIEVTDLDLRWVLAGSETGLYVCARDAKAEAAVCGKAIEFLLLASRMEDPDTLFFQRRLAVTGDTELGLTARNVLDQLLWEDLPMVLRIVLTQGTKLAIAARDTGHGKVA